MPALRFPLPGKEARWLVIAIAVAAAARIALAFATYGNAPDIANSRWALDALRDGDPLDFYAQQAGEPRWPYLLGFAPWLYVAGWLDARFGDFDAWLQLAPIAADIVLALVLYAWLRRARASVAVRRLSAGMILFGPVFFLISGHAFQFDSVAVLPALLGLLAWERDGPRRALTAGLLVGVAISLKPPLALAALALLPSARGAREAAAALAAAALLPAALLAPFLLAHPDATLQTLRGYTGLSGQAGLTALLAPSLAEIWLQTGDFSRYEPVFAELGGLVNLALLCVGTLIAGRYRATAVDTAALLALLLWTFAAGMSLAYLIWGLPFLLARARLRFAALVQGLGGVALLLLATAPHGDAVLVLYLADVVLLWAATLAGAVLMVREFAGDR